MREVKGTDEELEALLRSEIDSARRREQSYFRMMEEQQEYAEKCERLLEAHLAKKKEKTT